MKKNKFGILGGDLRYRLLFGLLKDSGYSADICRNKYVNSPLSEKEIIENSGIIIGPIPTTRDGRTMAFEEGRETEIEYVFSLMEEFNSRIYIGGVISENIQDIAQNRHIQTYDLFAMEEVAVRNAIPTGEGAIQTAMQESPKTLFGSKALVLGWGRCGKVLAQMLKGIGAEVTVTYRRPGDGAYLSAYGCIPLELKKLGENISRFDFIFNTIPAEILNSRILENVNKNALILDLAQAPGGTDFNYASKLNIKALYCPGLPGRVAPLTAAEILKDAVVTISHGAQ